MAGPGGLNPPALNPGALPTCLGWAGAVVVWGSLAETEYRQW